MLRIGSMNLLLHGVENPNIVYRDSLAQDHAGEDEKYTLVLANPPFAGSFEYENCARDLQQVVKTKKTSCFLALFLRLLKPGGRAAVIVPDGVLFGSSTAQDLRKLLVEGQNLNAVISLPGGAFKPYAGVSTAILLSPRPTPAALTTCGSTMSTPTAGALDDKRQPILPEDKLGPVPVQPLSAEEHAKNNLPDAALAAAGRGGTERPRTAQSFCVPKADIAANGYDLSINRYKEVIYEEVKHPTEQLLAELAELEREIEQG